MANQGCLGFLFNLFRVRSSPPAALPAGAFAPAMRDSLPYRIRQDTLLTDTELKFYRALIQTVGNAFTICPKIRVADILETRPFDQAYHNKIDRKHVDFLLCDPTTMRPVMAIELDDASHQRAGAQRRDQDKDAAFRAAGLPLVRIPVRQAHDPNQIRASLQLGMAPGITYEKAAPRQKATGPVSPTPIVGGRKPER